MKILRVAAAVVVGLSLGAGVVSAAPSTSTIDTTGRDSDPTVDIRNRETRRVRHDTNLTIQNNNPQDARSGEARAHDNADDDGDAVTGDARNDSLLRANVTVDNRESSTAALEEADDESEASSVIENTGRDSDPEVDIRNHTRTSVRSNTNVVVQNNNTQTSRSGDATVRDNTDGGNAETGDASNVNTMEVVIDVRH